MTNIITVCTLLAFFVATCALPVYADPTCTEPVPVTSPCVGVLLPPDAATLGLRCLKIDLPKLELDLEFQKKLFDVRINTLNKLLESETTRAACIESLLNR